MASAEEQEQAVQLPKNHEAAEEEPWVPAAAEVQDGAAACVTQGNCNCCLGCTPERQVDIAAAAGEVHMRCLIDLRPADCRYCMRFEWPREAG